MRMFENNKETFSFFYFGDIIFYCLHGVNINNIRIEYITESPFPLPPTLAEQQRIVNRIESMFAKLDEAKEKAQNVVDGFETRKAAILHKAFTGELTAKWRKENGVSDDSWEEKRFDEVAEIKSNLVDIAEYQDFPHIAPDNIEKKTGVQLLNETKELAKDANIFQKIKHWVKDTTVKSSEEVSSEEVPPSCSTLEAVPFG